MNEPVTPTALAWAAGFIDGDGSITIVGHKGQRCNSCMLQIGVGNRNRESLLRLEDLFGGSVTKHRKDGASGPSTFQWRATTRIAVACLRLIEPYLFIKRDQAQLGIEFQSILRTTNRRVPLTQDEIDLRYHYKRRMQFLNGRNLARTHWCHRKTA